MLMTAVIATLLAAAPAQDDFLDETIGLEEIVVLGEDELLQEEEESQEIVFEENEEGFAAVSEE